jgi:hypothetical protein
MEIIGLVTFAIAVLGAVLGLFNTWQAVDQSRVKILVIPKHLVVLNGDESLKCCIDIINLSAFPVSIDDAGFFYKGTDRRAAIVDPMFQDGGRWPRRLEPRSSITVFSKLPEPLAGHPVRCAYARTQCGRVATGSSPALKQISLES